MKDSMYSRLNQKAELYDKQTFQGEHDVGAHNVKDFKIAVTERCKFNISNRHEWFTNDSKKKEDWQCWSIFLPAFNILATLVAACNTID